MLGDGNTLHILWTENTDKDLHYTTFDCSTDAWSGTVELVESDNIWITNPTQTRVSMVKTANGDLVAVHMGHAERIMGTTYRKVSAIKRGASSWNTPVQWEGSVEESHESPVAIAGLTDKVHVMFHNSATNTVNWITFDASSETFSGETSSGGTDEWRPQNVYSYDDGGTLRIHWIQRDMANDELEVFETIESSGVISSGARQLCSGAVTTDYPQTSWGAAGFHSSATGKEYVIFHDSDTTDDVYLVEKDEGASQTWGTPSSIISTSTPNLDFSAAIVSRDSSTYGDLIYRDDVGLDYWEINELAAAGGSDIPIKARLVQTLNLRR
jgi:hypothetical protein